MSDAIDIIAAERLRDVIDGIQNDFQDMSLSALIGILDTLKLELFIEQRD